MSEKKMSFEEFSELVDNSDLSLDHMADMLAEEMKKAPKREPRPVQHVSPEPKWINEQIYRNNLKVVHGNPYTRAREMRRRQRMRDLFGVSVGHEYDIYEQYGACSAYIADVLINDAIRTGRRDDLPDELLQEYDLCVGGVS